MKALARAYVMYFTKKEFIRSFVFSVALFGISLLINFYAGIYATDHVSNSVTDIILNNIPVFDVDWLFIYGAFFMVLFILFITLLYPRKIPFVLRSIALFVIIRSVFITLTHLGPFPTQIPITATNIISKFSFGGDLFFSGHTGLPFLLALVFWDIPWLRWIFIFASVSFACIVLAGHLHYSIDVLSAFFITYTIYKIAEKLFTEEKVFFDTAHEPLA